MKILFISTWFPFPPDNGSKLRAYYLIKALSHSHEVTVIAFKPESQSGESETIFQVGGPVEVLGVPEDPFRYVGLPRIAKYISPLPLSAWPSSLMRETVSSAAFSQHWDAIVAFQIPAARYALIPSCKARIFDMDNSLSYMTRERAAEARSIVSRLMAQVSLLKSSRYEARMASQFQACTVVSSLEVEFIRDLVGGTSCRVELSENGVDCVTNKPGLAVRQKNALVYNGSLTYSANYDAMRWFLADIYPLIRQGMPDVSLSITGSIHGVKLAGLALDASTTLTGHVADVRIPVAKAAICVIPIRQGSGTRLKILEAMALGTPVVSTSKGAEGLEVVAGRHLLIADTARDFANNVTSLLGDPALRERLSSNARSLVKERYDWQLIGKRFVSMVEESVFQSTDVSS